MWQAQRAPVSPNLNFANFVLLSLSIAKTGGVEKCTKRFMVNADHFKRFEECFCRKGAPSN